MANAWPSQSNCTIYLPVQFGMKFEKNIRMYRSMVSKSWTANVSYGTTNWLHNLNASTDSKSMCIQSVEQSINWFPNRFQSQSAPNNILIPKSYTTICVFRVCACSFFFSIIEWKSVAMNRDHIISYVRTHKKMCIAFYLNARLLEWTSEEKTTCVFLTVIWRNIHKKMLHHPYMHYLLRIHQISISK